MIAGIVFALYVIGSLIMLSDPLSAIYFCLGLVAFGIGWTKPELTPSFWLASGLALVVTTPWFLPYGLLANPNALGVACALLIASSLAYDRYWLTPFYIAGLLYSGSRGAMLATGAIVLLKFWRRFPVSAICVLAFALVLVLADDRGPSSSLNRIGIWQDTAQGLTVFGHGLGNYLEWYTGLPRRTQGLDLVGHAYNDILELIWTFGIGSAALWVFLIWACEAPATERLIIVAFLFLGLSFFTIFILPFTLLAALTLGTLARKRQLLAHTRELIACSA